MCSHRLFTCMQPKPAQMWLVDYKRTTEGHRKASADKTPSPLKTRIIADGLREQFPARGSYPRDKQHYVSHQQFHVLCGWELSWMYCQIQQATSETAFGTEMNVQVRRQRLRWRIARHTCEWSRCSISMLTGHTCQVEGSAWHTGKVLSDTDFNKLVRRSLRTRRVKTDVLGSYPNCWMKRQKHRVCQSAVWAWVSFASTGPWGILEDT